LFATNALAFIRDVHFGGMEERHQQIYRWRFPHSAKAPCTSKKVFIRLFPGEIWRRDLEGRHEGRNGDAEVVEPPPGDAAGQELEIWALVHVHVLQTLTHLTDGRGKLNLKGEYFDLFLHKKTWVFFVMATDKHSSFQHYGINSDCKKVLLYQPRIMVLPAPGYRRFWGWPSSQHYKAFSLRHRSHGQKIGALVPNKSNLIFPSKADYISGASCSASSILGRLLALPANIILGGKVLPGTNALAYLACLLVTKKKMLL